MVTSPVIIVQTTGARLELRECAGDAILTAFDTALGTGVLACLSAGQAHYLGNHLIHIGEATR